MSTPVALWHGEHVYFRRLLELLHREVDCFHRGERPNYELMIDIVSYLREYTDQYHHPREDVAFERLAKRCPDLKLDLARLAQEHRIIARAGDRLREHLDSIVNGSLVSRVDVEVAAATYLVYYGNHIAREDEIVLPRAVALLEPEDWTAVARAVASKPDPLFGENPEQRYRALRRHIASHNT